MKKKLLALVLVLSLTLSMGLVAMACSDNDTYHTIVGTWERVFEPSEGIEERHIKIFEANGALTRIIYVNGRRQSITHATAEMRGSHLTINFNIPGVLPWTVRVEISENTFTMTEDGIIEKWTRVTN